MLPVVENVLLIESYATPDAAEYLHVAGSSVTSDSAGDAILIAPVGPMVNDYWKHQVF